MNNQSLDTQQTRYSESVWLSLWGIGILGLALGLTAGALTGVAVRNVIGDEPIITGSSAAIFYVTFAFAVLIDVFLLFNFTNLALRVSDEGFGFRYGMFSKTLKWDQITAVEATDYRWITYGGWGIRFSTKGRRAWSQLGIKRGVVVAVTEGGAERHYFVSSRKADELATALMAGLERKRGTADSSPTAPDPVAP